MRDSHADRAIRVDRHLAEPARWSDGSGIWRIVKVLVPAFAFGLAAWLVYRIVSEYSPDELVASVTEFPLARLGMAGLFAAASYVCLSGGDYLALHYVGKPISYPKVALASFTSLSIGHNIGLAALSSGAIRYRFYSRWGLSGGQVASLIVFCGASVCLGLLVMAGLALFMRPELAAALAGFGKPAAMATGVLALLLAAVYLVAAACIRRSFSVFGWRVRMPGFTLAVGQVALASLNVACVSACLQQTLLTAADIDYPSVVCAYALANSLAVISHVPGGLGILEAAVIFFLPQTHLVGALLVFRFVYFLMPLCIGGSAFLVSEIVRRRGRAGSNWLEAPD